MNEVNFNFDKYEEITIHLQNIGLELIDAIRQGEKQIPIEMYLDLFNGYLGMFENYKETSRMLDRSHDRYDELLAVFGYKK